MVVEYWASAEWDQPPFGFKMESGFATYDEALSWLGSHESASRCKITKRVTTDEVVARWVYGMEVTNGSV